jgi:hypothetical protein
VIEVKVWKLETWSKRQSDFFKGQNVSLTCGFPSLITAVKKSWKLET